MCVFFSNEVSKMFLSFVFPSQVMIQILKDMGVTDYEPRVINQMLEFTYSKLSPRQKHDANLHRFVRSSQDM